MKESNLLFEDQMKSGEFINPMKDFVINPDWLQLHVCTISGLSIFREDSLFEFIPIGQTKVFKRLYQIRVKKSQMIVGVYATDCNDFFLPKNHGILKFDNAFLYQANLYDLVTKCIAAIGFNHIALTRFDVAFDFLEFSNGMQPAELIQGIANGTYVRSRKQKVCISGEVPGEKVTVSGVATNKGMDVQYFRQGNRKSDVCVTLYNKSLEMREVKEKPWIRYVHDFEFGTENKKDVWRIEFSIKSFNQSFGHVFKEGLEILKPDNLYMLFRYLEKKYFDYRKNEPGQRVARMEKLSLFVFPESIESYVLEVPKREKILESSNRSEKLMIKRLINHESEFKKINPDYSNHCREVWVSMVELYGLEYWACGNGLLDLSYLNPDPPDDVSEERKPKFIQMELF